MKTYADPKHWFIFTFFPGSRSETNYSGSRKMFRIQPDPDSQHWIIWNLFCRIRFGFYFYVACLFVFLCCSTPWQQLRPLREHPRRRIVLLLRSSSLSVWRREQSIHDESCRLPFKPVIFLILYILSGMLFQLSVTFICCILMMFWLGFGGAWPKRTVLRVNMTIII